MTVEIISGNFRICGVTPSPLVVGSTGNKAVVTVTNTSVYAGTTTKAPFTFNVAITIQVPDGTTSTWGDNLGTLFLAAGATGTYTWTFNIPSTATPGVGRAYAFLANPAVPLTAIASATPVAVTVNAAAGATVNVTLRARNAPANAAYWIALCATYPYFSGFIPIANPIAWNNIPANTSQDYVIFACYNASQQPISTINGGLAVGFSKPFVNGKTYYWDFATGILLDEYFNWM
jgi:hypothetical protein